MVVDIISRLSSWYRSVSQSTMICFISSGMQLFNYRVVCDDN